LSASAGNARATEKIDTSFVRALVEFQNTVPLGRQVALRFKGGIGVAQGRIESDQTYSGTFVTILGAPRSYSASDKWTGITWEIGPALVITGEKIDLDIGLSYAGFPKLKENDDFTEFDWSALGIQVAIGFKPPEVISGVPVENIPAPVPAAPVQSTPVQPAPAQPEPVQPAPAQTEPMKTEPAPAPAKEESDPLWKQQ
jgi:hypothetical protein